MHCSLTPPDVTAVAFRFNYEAHSARRNVSVSWKSGKVSVSVSSQRKTEGLGLISVSGLNVSFYNLIFNDIKFSEVGVGNKLSVGLQRTACRSRSLGVFTHQLVKSMYYPCIINQLPYLVGLLQFDHDFEYRVYNLQQSSSATAFVVQLTQTTATSKFFDFTSNTAYWRTYVLKTEEHDISRYFQRYLDSAAVELDVLNDSVFDLGLIALQLFYAPCSSAR